MSSQDNEQDNETSESSRKRDDMAKFAAEVFANLAADPQPPFLSRSFPHLMDEYNDWIAGKTQATPPPITIPLAEKFAEIQRDTKASNLTSLTTIELFEQALGGIIPKLPNGFWQGDEGWQRIVECVRYVICEKLNVFDRDGILRLNFQDQITKPYRLAGATKHPNFSPARVLTEAFPEHNFKTWEFPCVPVGFWDTCGIDIQAQILKEWLDKNGLTAKEVAISIQDKTPGNAYARQLRKNGLYGLIGWLDKSDKCTVLLLLKYLDPSIKDQSICHETVRKRLAKKEGLQCPVCSKKVLHLTTHTRKVHFLGRKELSVDYGVRVFTHPSLINHKPNFLNRTHLGKVAYQISQGRKHATISLPLESWPKDCSYAKFTVDYKLNQFLITPITGPSNNTRRARIHHARINIELPKTVLDQIMIMQPVSYLSGPMVILQFKSPEPLQVLEDWVLGRRSSARCSTYRSVISSSRITILKELWPLPAVYCLPEWIKTTRSKYLDLLPVGKTGEIILPSGEFGQYVGVDQCVKPQLYGKRIVIYPQSFFKTNLDLPETDWLFVGRQKNGALRFKPIPTAKSTGDSSL